MPLRDGAGHGGRPHLIRTAPWNTRASRLRAVPGGADHRIAPVRPPALSRNRGRGNSCSENSSGGCHCERSIRSFGCTSHGDGTSHQDSITGRENRCD